jgi:hypothetical protein
MSIRTEVPLWLRELCERLQSDDGTLLEVNLNLRRLNRPMMQLLAQVVQNSRDLRSLNLTSSLIDQPDISSSQVLQPFIFSVLPSSTSSLKILHVSYNRLASPLEGLGLSLSKNQSLTELYLDHNRINCNTVIDLSYGLVKNQTLRLLELSSNLIADVGAMHLSKALAQNKSLEFLGLSRNLIGEVGAISLLESLWKHKNCSLKVLSLQNNPTVSVVTRGWISSVCRANSLGRRILLFEGDSMIGLTALILAKARSSPEALYIFFLEMHSKLIATLPETMDETYNRPTKRARDTFDVKMVIP